MDGAEDEDDDDDDEVEDELNEGDLEPKVLILNRILQMELLRRSARSE